MSCVDYMECPRDVIKLIGDGIDEWSHLTIMKLQDSLRSYAPVWAFLVEMPKHSMFEDTNNLIHDVVYNIN